MLSAYIFAIVATIMLANGLVLAVITRDLPVDFRPATNTWQIGTFLIAAGCGLVAGISLVSHPLALVIANATFLFGLSAYASALAKFFDREFSIGHYLPVLAGIATVFWFSVFDENFKVRLLVISIAWCWLMLASMRLLTNLPHHHDSASRKVLLAIFTIMVAFIALRAIIIIAAPLSPGFNITTTASTLNLITPFFLGVLPIVGTTVFILMCSDRIRMEWEKAASTDFLTRLPNRRVLMQRAERLFNAADKSRSPLTVAIFDIDGFKKINDMHGHEAGDLALQHVANILEAGVGRTDMVARTGGEEFVLLMEALPGETIEMIRETVARTPLQADGVTVPITVSAGVATRTGNDREFSSLMRRADLALYAAKSRGRNRVEISKAATGTEKLSA